jgi:hypothetical protein
MYPVGSHIRHRTTGRTGTVVQAYYEMIWNRHIRVIDYDDSLGQYESSDIQDLRLNTDKT